MFDEDLYRKVDKTIKELFASNWEVGFDLWRRCLFNIQMLVEDTLPYDMRYGGIPFLYEAGYLSGKRIGEELMDRFNLHNKSMKERAYFMDAFVKNAGVGDPGFVTILEGKKGIRFPGGTYFAKAYGRQAGHTICTNTAGFIAGATDAITGKRWFVREVKCLAAGDEYCEFVVEQKD
ncbi:MAG: V4R domain-containing protein [Candidatus Syntropharchaeales archaeon]|nr:4-vinyl reductase [Candidatus Syntrophoarchaeum sp.]